MDLVAQNGARIVDVEPYLVNGSKRFAALMVNNSNALTSRLAALLRYGADGATGLFLKRVNGSVLASLQPDFVFEPASTIKALIHLYALSEVQSGDATLGELINYCATMNGSCPIDPPCNGPDRSLEWQLQQMMWMSDNPATEAVTRRFGRAAINAFAGQIGMSLSQLNHIIGCGGPTPNELTARDIATLYEEVATGILTDDLRDTFYELMSGKDPSYADGTIDFTGAWGAISGIINEEAAALGLSTTVREAFKRQIRFANKAGGYGVNGLSYVSQAGWISLPICQNDTAGAREYVFSFFVHGAESQSSVDARFATLRGEILREPIRDALGDFTSPCGDVITRGLLFVRGDSNHDHRLDVSDGVRILDFLFQGGAAPTCMDAADVNDSGAVDISDASAVFAFLFLGGSAPPGADAGRFQGDRTPDALECESYPQPERTPEGRVLVAR
jgi:hypothetical protein